MWRSRRSPRVQGEWGLSFRTTDIQPLAHGSHRRHVTQITGPKFPPDCRRYPGRELGVRSSFTRFAADTVAILPSLSPPIAFFLPPPPPPPFFFFFLKKTPDRKRRSEKVTRERGRVTF